MPFPRCVRVPVVLRVACARRTRIEPILAVQQPARAVMPGRYTMGVWVIGVGSRLSSITVACRRVSQVDRGNTVADLRPDALKPSR